MDETPLARWRREVRAAIPRADRDLVEEVAQHLADQWRSLKARGLSDAEAGIQIRRELEQWRRTPLPAPARERERAISGSLTDLRDAFRSMRARPSLTLAGVLLTAAAAVATVTTFAIAYGILWRPLPYPQSARLAVLWQVERGAQSQISYPD